MPTQYVKDILQEFKKRLKMIYKDSLKEVILFGSMARGEFTEESDIDVLIVLDNITNYGDEFNKIFWIERVVEKKHDDKIIISSILTTQNDYNTGLEPLYLNVRKEGVPL